MHFWFYRLKAWLYQMLLYRLSVFNSKFTLMARFSHEFRTSLTGIVGYSEFLESSSTEPMMSFTAKIIRESSQNLIRTSDSFFDLNCLTSGQIKARCSEFSINQLICSVVSLYHKQAIKRNATLTFTSSTETSLLDIYGDAYRVRQVLDALVFSAVQVAGKGTSIHLNTLLCGNDLIVNITINSLGSLTHGSQNKFLKEFWSNERYKFRLQEGPGIELALAKKMIYFLQGNAKYYFISDEISRLVVRLPVSYRD